jgi:cob(I)alamin adenosyltransferase
MAEEKGLIMVYTGDGKGKTTAALGLALRTVGHGARVMMVQFMKGRTYGELLAAQHLPGFEILMTGRDAFVDCDNPDEIDVQMAKDGFAKAVGYVQSGQYQMVILDELNVAVDYGLIDLKSVLDLIDKRPPGVDLVITGRGASPALIQIADLVSEVKEIKHHYQQGIDARPGIEY